MRMCNDFRNPKFPFCTSCIILGFGPISILVNIGEVRGSVYFSNWAIQNNFFSNAEALRRLHSHKFSVSQTPDRTGNLCGLPMSSGRICWWAQDSQSCAEKVFCKLLELNWLRRSRNHVTRTKVFLQGHYPSFFSSLVPYITPCHSF